MPPLSAPLGAGATPDLLNARFCALVQARQNQAISMAEFAAYVDNMGTAGLEVLGFDSATAGSFQGSVDLAKTDALVWVGQATQGTTENFAAGLAAYIGPTPQQSTL